MITYNNKDILKSFIGNNRVIKKYLNNEVVYGTPDFAQYYNIQGYDNYEVVGSPTITDGIVSNFTYDNYFKTTESISTTGISSFEFYSRVKTPTTFSNGWCRICSAGNLGNQGTTAGIWSNASVTQSFFHLFGIDIYQQLLTTDTWYRIQYLYSPSSYTATVYDDNGNVLKSYTYSNPKLNLQGVINFCQRHQNYVLGAIDLNNTYIKVNGKYWFNGNPNYKELIWANPNVYIKNDGTKNWIDTEFTAENNGYSYEADIKFVGTTRQLMGFGGSYREYWGYANSTQFEMGRSDYITVTSANHRVKAKFEWSYTGTSSSYTVTETLNINDQSATSTVKNANMTSVINNKKHYFLFRMNGYTGYYCDAKLYSHKIYDNSNNLVQYLVPVPKGLLIGSYKVPSNGMFDIVTQTFFENKGSGEFIWGVDL